MPDFEPSRFWTRMRIAVTFGLTLQKCLAQYFTTTFTRFFPPRKKLMNFETVFYKGQIKYFLSKTCQENLWMFFKDRKFEFVTDHQNGFEKRSLLKKKTTLSFKVDTLGFRIALSKNTPFLNFFQHLGFPWQEIEPRTTRNLVCWTQALWIAIT